ncbi:hypothetical protein TNCV_651391 [Trichonephila clavipes]|nr:hypothetical protein TNCV_651391 [Trichonephila clavipes]
MERFRTDSSQIYTSENTRHTDIRNDEKLLHNSISCSITSKAVTETNYGNRDLYKNVGASKSMHFMIGEAVFLRGLLSPIRVIGLTVGLLPVGPWMVSIGSFYFPSTIHRKCPMEELPSPPLGNVPCWGYNRAIKVPVAQTLDLQFR